MKYYFIFIIIFLIIFFINYFGNQIDFINAIIWPTTYDTVSSDSLTDKAADASGEHEIHEGQATDTFHNIFTRFKIEGIPANLLTDTAYQIFFNPPGYDSIWYRFKLKYKGSSTDKYDLQFFRSTNNQATWVLIENRLDITLTGGEYDSGTLGIKKTDGAPGYLAFYTKKSYIEEPASSFNYYYSTHFGTAETQGDRAPDTGTASDTLTEPIDQMTVGLFVNLAPDKVTQGEINVLMTRFALSTNANKVEWTALKIDKKGTSTKDADIERVKIWKDDGDQNFETNHDMLVAEAINAFVNSVASITLNPTQILTTTNAYYFITYDINWFSDPDVTVGLYMGDKTYFTVSSPDNVNLINFPFETGNPKITPANYLSFYIAGISANTNIESEITDISTGGAGWIDFGNLEPNEAKVAGQQLNITTNAWTGYLITIKENQNLTNANKEIIPDISGTNATPHPWPPEGGFGYHTSDNSLKDSPTDRFSNDNTYARITSTPEEVAYRNNPTSPSGEIISIIYKIEINPTQPIGEYRNIITYICTSNY